MGYYGTVLSIKSNEDIANRSGAFDRPNPVAYMGELKLAADGNQIVYGDGYGDSVLVVTRIPIVIKNEGGKTVNKLKATFSYPVSAKMKFDFGRTLTTFGRNIDEKIRLSRNSYNDFESFSYDLPNLNPGEIFILNEYIALPRTLIKDTISLPDQPNSRITDVYFSVPVKLSITATDIKVNDHVIEVMCLSASNMEEFVDEIEQLKMNGKLSPKDRDSLIKKAGWNVSVAKNKFIAEYVIADSAKSNFGRNLYIVNENYENLFYVDYR
jgi:hypothetical protein